MEEYTYWQPRVMRHRMESGDEYAIHEVYFNGSDGMVDTYTLAAISPKAPSIAELKRLLMQLLEQEEEEFPLGDMQYIHHKEDIKFWFEFIDLPILEYDADESLE